jgi:hypothetical protein
MNFEKRQKKPRSFQNNRQQKKVLRFIGFDQTAQMDVIGIIALAVGLAGIIWFAAMNRSLVAKVARLERVVGDVEKRPFRIYLVRHGESQGNVDETIYERIPDSKIPLTKRGELLLRF